jgi:hypothetical protein
VLPACRNIPTSSSLYATAEHLLPAVLLLLLLHTTTLCQQPPLTELLQMAVGLQHYPPTACSSTADAAAHPPSWQLLG